MAQKINSNIFRLGKTKKWESKYFEKKSTELAIYSFKNLEIRSFIKKILSDNGLILNNLKLYFINNNLRIFASYYLSLKSIFLIRDLNKIQKIKVNDLTDPEEDVVTFPFEEELDNYEQKKLNKNDRIKIKRTKIIMDRNYKKVRYRNFLVKMFYRYKKKFFKKEESKVKKEFKKNEKNFFKKKENKLEKKENKLEKRSYGREVRIRGRDRYRRNRLNLKTLDTASMKSYLKKKKSIVRKAYGWGVKFRGWDYYRRNRLNLETLDIASIKLEEEHRAENLKLSLPNNVKRYLKYKKEFPYCDKQDDNPLKTQRVQSLKYYKHYLVTKNHINIKNIKSHSFLIKKILKSLIGFIDSKIKVSLTLKQLNKNVAQTLNKKEITIIKEDLNKLQRFKKNKFFKEGVNLLFACAKNKKSAGLLAQFIANQLKILKKHNFFIYFIKATLKMLNDKSVYEGIKVEVKGRFNGANRARQKIINIGSFPPLLSVKAVINYAEATAYNPKSTFGVKIWTYVG